MCLAVPLKIEKIVDNRASVTLDGNRIDADISIVPKVKVGDWVLVHAGYALSVLDEDEARETFDILKQHCE